MRAPGRAVELLQLDGYIRVSRIGLRHGERFISPKLQRQQIQGWAALRGAVVLNFFEELDESGQRADRPKLEAAIRRIEGGLSDGLVVWKVSRFGRSMIDGLKTIERIRTVGGVFCSASEGLDTSTEAGRLVLRILLSIAEWDLEQIRDGWDLARADAIARGVYTGAYAPAGYRKLPSGRLTPDGRAARIIGEVFTRRAAGESIPSLARYLERRRVLTGVGNPGWSPQTLRRVIANRMYLGELHCGRHVKANAHPALTDPATWEVAQHPRPSSAREQRPPALLAGLLRCAGCGMSMTAHPQSRPHGYHDYLCRGHYSAGKCPARASIAGGTVDDYVVDVAFSLLRRRRKPPLSRLSAAEERLSAAQTALASYRDSDRVLATLGAASFAAGVAARVKRVRDAGLDVASARARLGAHSLPPAAELDGAWGAMSTLERRAVLRQLVDCVFVHRAPRGTPAADRVTVCPTGTGPRDLTRAGDKHPPLRSFAPRRGWIRALHPSSEATK